MFEKNVKTVKTTFLELRLNEPAATRVFLVEFVVCCRSYTSSFRFLKIHWLILENKNVPPDKHEATTIYFITRNYECTVVPIDSPLQDVLDLRSEGWKSQRPGTQRNAVSKMKQIGAG